MMANLTRSKNTNLIRLVEERALLKKEQDKLKKKQQENLVPHIPKECIFNILVRLPLESLQRSRFVCKPWYKLINNPIFIDAHLRRSSTVLIFLDRFVIPYSYSRYSMPSVPQAKPNTLSVEDKLLELQSVHALNRPLLDPRSKFCIKFMEVKDGQSKIGEFNATCLGQIRTTCNGLIVLDNQLNKGGLIVLNPVTRELTGLPLGTLYSSHDETYGLAFCGSARTYKLVHLFRDEMNFIGCEILDLKTRFWRVVDGPSFGLLSWFGYEPVCATGALHWVPHIDHSEYIVSMAIDEEKFYKIDLPKSCRSHDRIVDVNGYLGFVTHEEMNQIDLWILMNLSADSWVKHYTISVGCIKDMVPLYYSGTSDEMIFRDKDESIFAYDFCFHVMRKVDIHKGCFFPSRGCCLPHVNSLVSWKNPEKDQNESD